MEKQVLLYVHLIDSEKSINNKQDDFLLKEKLEKQICFIILTSHETV